MFSRNLRNYNTKAQVLKIKNGKDKVEKDTECDKNENLPQKSDGSSEDAEKTKDVVVKPQVPCKLNVSILGANVHAGVTTSLFLKQHQLIRRISLFGTDYVKDIAEDLNLIDTKSKVYGYTKPTEINRVLSVADIVILIDTDWKTCNEKNKLNKSFDRIKFFAKKIRSHSPKAFIINCVEPICCTTMLLHILLQKSPLFKFNRLIGSIAPLQSQVNRAVGRYLHLDPKHIYVPIIGGPSYGTFIPLLNLITPNINFTEEQRIKCFRFILKEIDLRNMYYNNKSLYFEGVAIAKQTILIARALLNQEKTYSSCFVRNRILQTKSSFVTTVRFGPEGVDKIYSLPKMEGYEITEFTKSIADLHEKEKHVKVLCERSGLYNKVLDTRQ